LPSSWWFLRSLQFITNKFGGLTLQEPESCGIIGSGIGRLPLAPVQVSLINEAQLGHGLNKLGKMDSDHTGDKVDHTPAILAATTDPIYQTPLESDSEGGREIYMVGNVDELPDKTVEEIQWETDKERGTIAYRTTRVHWKMNLRMVLMRGDTTRSSIHYTQ
jgi:hypothetical protein